MSAKGNILFQCICFKTLFNAVFRFYHGSLHLISSRFDITKIPDVYDSAK